MQNYRKSSHSTYDLKYHIVWITKYRKKALTGEVAVKGQEVILLPVLETLPMKWL